MARLSVLVCHLSGTGHLVRMLRIARAAQARGHDVQVISGGRPLAHLDTDGVRLVQLPPLTVAALDFSSLRTGDGAVLDTAYRARRIDAIQSALTARPPDALITELFPFGRRQLAEEFLTAIQIARSTNPAAKIVCSVRDIPEPKPKRVAEAAERLRTHFDAVLVHGDAGFIPLSLTWPLPQDLSDRIHHTGYVGEAAPPDTPEPGDTILVATGGGNLGHQVLGVAAQAALGSRHPWHLLVGGAEAAAAASALAAQHNAANLRIDPARSDYAARLSQTACSISLCGYNTAVELAVRDTPALFIPSDEGGEREQTIRAQHLASFAGIEMLTTAQATPETLRDMAHRLAAGPRRAPLPLSVDDGTRAILALEKILLAN